MQGAVFVDAGSLWGPGEAAIQAVDWASLPSYEAVIEELSKPFSDLETALE